MRGRLTIFVLAAVAATAIAVVRHKADDGSPKATAPTASPSPSRLPSGDAPPLAEIVRDAKLSATAKSKREPRDVENAVQLVDGSWGIKTADGTIVRGAALFEPDEPTIEGAISIRQMMLKHRAEATVMQRGTESTRQERDECMVEFVRRGGSISKRYDWVVALTFQGNGSEIRVTKVQAPRELWPDEFDEQVKDCYLESFARIRFDGTERLDMTVEFPLCVYPPN